jgi:lipopolysaccharide export system ATP-binding protein
MYKRARRGIGYLPQESSVFRRLSVEHNILAILEMLGYSRSERMERVETLLKELDLVHIRKVRPMPCRVENVDVWRSRGH